MLSLGKDSVGGLPKIHSQKRVHTALERKENSRDTDDRKQQPNNRQLRRAASTANTGKVIKYETTGLMYSKKIAELHTQNNELDRQLRKVQEEIQSAKKISANMIDYKKSDVSIKQRSNFITELTDNTQSKVSIMSKNSSKDKTFNSQIKLAENRLQIMRKKIDEQILKNKKTRNEVDKIRREINTLKDQNKVLQASLVKTKEEFDEATIFSKKLDEEMAAKNALMHKAKVQNQHKKTEMIKQYNEILRQLDKELAEEGKGKTEFSVKSEQVLYFTEFDQKQTTSGTELRTETNISNPKFSQIHSKRSKNMIPISSQMSAIKSKLDNYEKELQEVKKKTGTTNTDQIIKKFDVKYEQNFDFYKYVNELHASLEEKKRENQQLVEQRDKLIEEVSVRPSEVRSQEIQKLNQSLAFVRNQKDKYAKFCEFYTEFVSELRQIIENSYQKIFLGQSIDKSEPIPEDKILEYLVNISKRCSQLEGKFMDHLTLTNPSCSGNQADLNQMLQTVTKQVNNDISDPKSQKLLSRQQFLKARQTFLKKKPTANRKPPSKR